MDDRVIRAMARWPSVPAVFGWLRLDRRGRWLLVDRSAEHEAGPDAGREPSASPITNPLIVDFIARNYAADAAGRWYWQNGPQRVYVDLETTPFVLRVLGATPASPRFVAHTGAPVSSIEAGWLGPGGEVLLDTDLGPSVVHDLDLAALDIEERGASLVLRLGEREMSLAHCGDPPAAMGFVARPRAD